MYPTPIKYFLEGTKVLFSIIVPIIKEVNCCNAWEFVARHCANGSYKIKVIDFDQSYSPGTHSDSFIINIAIADMNGIISRILDVSNAFQNKNIPIHERVCVIPPPYYIYWFEIYYTNITLNIDDGPFCLQRMNEIQGRKPARI